MTDEEKNAGSIELMKNPRKLALKTHDALDRQPGCRASVSFEEGIRGKSERVRERAGRGVKNHWGALLT